MKVRDLIEELEEMNPDAEVRFASQPNWPFEYSISSVVRIIPDDDECDTDKETVYLVEGRQIGYLPGIVKNEIGW